MKVLNNKRGSAILWCILLIVILTILLASVLTASSAYFNYTVNSIQKQQAYFTARSAISTLLEEFSQSDETHVTSSGSSIYTYNSSIDLMPAEGETIEITSFEGLDSSLGEVTGTIKLNDDDSEKVDITVTAYYPDKTNGKSYTMHATVARQPLYFGGIAVKNLVLGANSKFVLGENTDLYYYTYRNTELLGTNTANTFDTSTTGLGANGSTIVINGNLITQGDAKIGKNTVVAGHRFNADTSFTKSNHPKKVWNSSQYILTNRTLTVKENSGKYSTSVSNVANALGNMTTAYCNNSRKTMTDSQVRLLFGTEVTRTAVFGSSLSLMNSATTTVINAFDKVYNYLSGSTEKGPFAKLTADNSISDLAITGSSSDGLAVKYIQILSLGTSMQTLKSDAITYLKDNLGFIGSIAASALDNTISDAISKVINEYSMTVMDISYIEFDASNLDTYGDTVYPVTYMFIEGNDTQGIYCRIKYGQKPDSESALYKLGDRIGTSIDNLAANWFNIVKSSSFVVVYLGENSTLELGTQQPYMKSKGIDPEFTKANQTYFYTIQGSTGSKVILNGQNDTGVPLTLVGGIQCDDVEIRGNVNIIYSSTNGSQVAKQKVGDFWTVVNYSD